ncbi:MAG: PilC/PilY family type IV pilus protein [Thermodesulfobacteriota bacterium]
MFNKFGNLGRELYKIKILLVFSVLVLVTGARGDEIIKNQVEDISILISQIVGGRPNVLLLYDNSLSMGDNFGGSQVASWDVDAVIGTCGSFQTLKKDLTLPPGNRAGQINHPTNSANYAVAHCAGNAAGLNPCGSIACSTSQTGTCQTPENFNRFLACIESRYTPAIASSAYSQSFNSICGGPNPSDCDTDAERAQAASAIENITVQQANLADPANNPLTCGAEECLDDTIADKSCDDPGLFSNFMSCMDTPFVANSCEKTVIDPLTGLPTIVPDEDVNCTKFKYGTTRWDAVVSTFFDILDADDSLGSLMCDDPNGLFTGSFVDNGCGIDPASPTSGVVCCDQFMNTPFRNVSSIVKGTGDDTLLPITNGEDTPIIDQLTPVDASEFDVRIRPMTFGGGGGNDAPPGDLSGVDSCTGNDITGQPQGGFAGGSIQNFDNVWKFFRDRRVGGRSPLANAIGFDDDNTANSTIGEDVLDSFRVELQTDPACACRAEFMIVVTGGLDNCSGDCSLPGTSGSCSVAANGVPLLVTGFSNMRSSIQAISNLRTYYARHPVNCGGPLKKEVLTFVIGMGVKGLEAVKTLNAMALGGGTHTTGIIKHVDPEGILVGTIEPLNVLPDPGDQIFRDFGQALSIDTNPSDAQLKNCLITDAGFSETGVCNFQGTDVFENTFFTSAGALDSDALGNSFAFFVDDPSELVEALEQIIDFIGNFPTAGVAPTAPTSAASVAVSDRILLANLTANPPERLWQGRLALYSFVDEPGNPGSKVVIRKPPTGVDLTDPAVVDSLRIFTDKGVLNANALGFFWEAAKLLTERDIGSDPRRLFTVIRTDPDTIDEEVDLVTSEVLRLRYEGDEVDFNLSSTDLDLNQFGISDADVTDPIPTFCAAAPPDGYTDCTGDCPVDGVTGNLVTPVSDDCITCVTQCIRDKTIDFMTGNTRIYPLGDALGSPVLVGQLPDSIGYNCPDLTDGNTLNDNYATCAVRLGDIFHSTPVLVGSPSPLFFDEGFQSFASQFKDRSAAVFVGANDGFIHSFHGGELVSIPPGGTVTNPFNLEEESVPFFNPGTGVELFAFAPPSFLPDSISDNGPESPSGVTPPDYRFGDFKTFVAEKNEQRSFADGSALIADVFIDGYANGIAEDAALCPGAVNTPDGNIDVCGREWHTLLISGFRNGGGAYTALDVTNVECAGGVGTDCSNVGKHLTNGPDYPAHIWTLFDHDFGNTWSEPAIGRVRMTADNGVTDVTVDRWVMFVGGGMDPLDTDPTDGVTFGDAFYAIDIPTGKIIFKFNPDDPVPSDLTDTDLAEMECDISARAGVFDLNADGYMDVAYAGDTCGRMWRFDISRPIVADNLSLTGLRGDADITAPDWTGDIAFCATADLNQCLDPSTIPVDPITFISQRMPIYFAPTAVFDDLGQLHVIFVTGSRRNPSSTLQFGKLYNFIDPSVPAFLAGGSAVSAPTKTEADFNAGQIIDIVPLAGVTGQFTTEGGSTVNNQGEFIVRFPDNLDSSVDPSIESPMGEKGFGPPVVIARALLFTTFAPDPAQENVCAAGAGEGRLFALDYLSGEPALARVPGAENLLGGDPDERADTAGKTVAFGMPTPAQLTFGARGSVVMTVAFSGSSAAGGANFLVLELPQLATRTQTLFWEELL